MICQEAPALVYDRGRRRDEGLGLPLFAKRMVDTRDGEPDLALAEKPAGLILVHLADALGVSVMLREDSQRRRGPNPRRRFRCHRFIVTMAASLP